MKSLVTRVGTAVGFVLLLAAMTAPSALANYVYWPNTGGLTIGRAPLTGGTFDNSFLTTAPDLGDSPNAVAVDAHHIYWAHGDDFNGAIGRANLDGTGVEPNFVPHSAGVISPGGVAVSESHVYWTSKTADNIGRANLDGSQPNSAFIAETHSTCGIVAQGNFLYYTVDANGGPAPAIARAPIGGGAPDDTFIPVPGGKDCGVAADPSHLYWTNSTSSGIVRSDLNGGQVDNGFITGIVAYGVAVTPQYVFWASGFTDHSVGRAKIDGTGAEEFFIHPGTGTDSTPYVLAASPSSQFTVGTAVRNKKNGTAKLSVTVPGPGALVADAASKGTQAVASKKKSSTVRRVQKTAGGAGTLTLKIRANGKALKALRKKGKTKVKVGITFTPQGVAGVPALTTTKLVLKRR